MPANVGITNPQNLQTNEVIFPVYEYTREIYFREAPLFTGLPRALASANRFNMGTARVRPRTYTLGAAVADGVVTTITLSDASVMQVGDILQLNSGERVEVTADPTITNTTTGAGTVTVRRGIEGTTGAAQTISTPVILVGNSRTGGEIDVSGVRSFPFYIQQNVQTFQYAVQTGGLVNAMTSVVTSFGGNTFNETQLLRLKEMVRDVEHTLFYGIGEFGAGANRNKMVGLRQLLTANASSNIATSPANAGAYTPNDLYRDLFQPIITAGGVPDTVLMSPSFATCLTRWGWSKLFLTPGDGTQGLATMTMTIPLLSNPVTIILDYQLRGFTACAIESNLPETNESGVKLRYVRQEFWNQRGNRGDAAEGEWIGDFALDVSDITHHAWVEGVTAFGTP